jgi:hypothetical protein
MGNSFRLIVVLLAPTHSGAKKLLVPTVRNKELYLVIYSALRAGRKPIMRQACNDGQPPLRA